MKEKRRSSCLLVFVLLVFTISLTPAFLQAANRDSSGVVKKARIVFLVTEDPDNYQAHQTIPVFAKMLREQSGYEAIVLEGSGGHGSYSFDHLNQIRQADLLVVFARRIALPTEQIHLLKTYLASGKPLIGIRTANHAFTIREKIDSGFQDWPDFVSEILGCENRGYGPVALGTDITVTPAAARHPILQQIDSQQWHSQGNVYLVSPLLDKNATVLLQGKAGDTIQPVAWTRRAGASKIFYTSLGHPSDFTTPQFNTLLQNAIRWCLAKAY